MSVMKVVFITGTRADYGKLKPLMKACDVDCDIQSYIFVTGMHLISEYGDTYRDIQMDDYSNVYMVPEYKMSGDMDIDLANTIINFSRYVKQIKPDLIVVHGDRIEPLAGAIVGVLNNVKVCHIEGGEVTGTADEFMRHAVSKLSSIHFVSNDEAKFRLIQLGEREKSIIVFGSPDIDVMLSDKLPLFEDVKKINKIYFDKYAIFCYHPVTTSRNLEYEVVQVIDAIKESNKNFVVIFPNNDKGTEIIIDKLNALKRNERFLMYKSLPFEEYLTVLKNADFVIGNSSAGIREACIYGVPAIDIGNRQHGRYNLRVLRNIQHAVEKKEDILDCISKVDNYRFVSYYYGNGHSAEIFLKTIKDKQIKNIGVQKTFIDSSETVMSIANYINEVSF